MQKCILLVLIAVPLTGCIGRTITYEPDFSQKTRAVSKPVAVETVYRGYTNFILSRNPKLGKDKANNISAIITKYSNQFGLDTKLVLALIATESSFRADVVSPTGAIGLGQLLKATARDMGVDNPFDPEENVKGTTKLLSKLFKQWEGNVERTLASYKTGAGTVTRLINANKDFPAATKKYISEIKFLQAKIFE